MKTLIACVLLATAVLNLVGCSFVSIKAETHVVNKGMANEF